MKYIVAIICAIALQGCTYARYTNQDTSLLVIDLHPTGNTVALDAALTGKGRVTLNRESGSADGLIEEVGNVVSANPLD